MPNRIGAAYLFDTTTGRQIAKLKAEDGRGWSAFGTSVGLAGNTAIVGAHQGLNAGTQSGAAYLFDVTTGRQTAKLTPSDAGEDDRFGVSVAISGSTAIVGAFYDDDRGNNSGSAYLFDVNTGNQMAKLIAPDGAEDDIFGYSVGISGQLAIVGAYLDDDTGINSGSAYIFDVASGALVAKLLAPDGCAADMFGFSVAISGSTAIVGAFYHDGQWQDAGAAYVYDALTGECLFELVAADGLVYEHFGYSVSMSGGYAVIGAPWKDEGRYRAGAAYIFTPEPATLSLLALGGLAMLRRRRRLAKAAITTEHS